ncbi:hypothetical protein BKA70DRAFT_1349515 [Coprinopsis sp. MPI-PUGE-AT-0042]|nr:hypothetical protein BKA70DRAFT_1349515 [Coprinopsis sp. MPI-PUGE-AT-0042]
MASSPTRSLNDDRDRSPIEDEFDRPGQSSDESVAGPSRLPVKHGRGRPKGSKKMAPPTNPEPAAPVIHKRRRPKEKKDDEEPSSKRPRRRPPKNPMPEGSSTAAGASRDAPKRKRERPPKNPPATTS